MATIRRVTIHRLRYVEPGCTFELHPGLNVVLGQNGTGKTTLLQWMADLLSGDLQSWANEPYRVEVEMEAAVEQERARLRMLVDNEIAELLRRTNLAMTRLIIEFGDQSYEIQQRRNRIIVHANDALLVDFEGHLPILGSSDSPAGLILKAVMALKQNNDVQGGAARYQAQGHLVFVMRDVVSSYRGPIRCFDESLDSSTESSQVRHPRRRQWRCLPLAYR